jgi:hypothetical protein
MKRCLRSRVPVDPREALAEAKRDLVAGARVAVKRNAAGNLVFAVIVPAVRVGVH